MRLTSTAPTAVAPTSVAPTPSAYLYDSSILFASFSLVLSAGESPSTPLFDRERDYFQHRQDSRVVWETIKNPREPNRVKWWLVRRGLYCSFNSDFCLARCYMVPLKTTECYGVLASYCKASIVEITRRHSKSFRPSRRHC